MIDKGYTEKRHCKLRLKNGKTVKTDRIAKPVKLIFANKNDIYALTYDLIKKDDNLLIAFDEVLLKTDREIIEADNKKFTEYLTQNYPRHFLQETGNVLYGIRNENFYIPACEVEKVFCEP